MLNQARRRLRFQVMRWRARKQPCSTSEPQQSLFGRVALDDLVGHVAQVASNNVGGVCEGIPRRPRPCDKGRCAAGAHGTEDVPRVRGDEPQLGRRDLEFSRDEVVHLRGWLELADRINGKLRSKYSPIPAFFSCCSTAVGAELVSVTSRNRAARSVWSPSRTSVCAGSEMRPRRIASRSVPTSDTP